MLDMGLLLALPAQSVAVRLVFGAVIALVVVRLLLRARFRNAGVRVVVAMLPVAVLVALAVVSLADPRLPALMVPAAHSPSQVVMGNGSDYLYLAPLTLPALVAAWGVVATGLMTLRTVRGVRASREARGLRGTGMVSGHLQRVVRVTANRLVVPVPDVVVADCRGGAAVIGIRQPVLLLDARFVACLDDHELQGVVAHELAHIARRDNLLAYLAGLARDLTFFLPGGSWALRRLMVERELAADQTAVGVTKRPGALAAGLLKVVDAVPSGNACAALVARGTLQARVETLCAAQPAPKRWRTTTEVVIVGAVFAALVVTAVIVPRWVAGADPESGVAVLLSTSSDGRSHVTPAEDPGATASSAVAGGLALPAWTMTSPPQALRSYQATVEDNPVFVDGRVVGPDDDDHAISAGMLATCRRATTCDGLRPDPDRTLQLHPRPVLVQRDFEVRWHAQPVGGGDNDSGVVRFYYLSSLPQ